MNLLKQSMKLISLLFILSSASVYATDQIYTGYFNNKAVTGYDVITFFENKNPLEGSAKYKFKFQGADWYFSSQANLDKFVLDPLKYAPQYGGYCAWAMSNDKTAPGNVPFWTIYKNKLYLNYDQKVQDTWRENKDAFIYKADKHWANKVKD